MKLNDVYNGYIVKARESIRAISSLYKDHGEKILEAFNFALELHQNQTRKSGEPYIAHPVAVAEILTYELKIHDPILIMAALLHDVVEDVESININHIRDRFGEEVANIVDGCTKIVLDPSKGRQLAQIQTHTKLFLSSSNNLGIIVLKLADRLHNMRTLHALNPDKKMRIAKETLDIYAPIAARLNIYYLKREFLYQSLLWLYPNKSKKILNHIKTLHSKKEVLEIKDQLEEHLKSLNVPITVRSRCKGLGSYYDPVRKTLDIYNAENFVDFTIVAKTDNPLCCYEILGKVNAKFPPLPRTLRDFISNPKSNGYQSLHTRFHYKDANYLLKIRTEKMDKWALYGILNHWHYKSINIYESDILKFLKEIGEYNETSTKRKDVLQSNDGEIIVYTPTGEPHYLPKNSTVLDFAYKIHSDLGDRCEGARIGGKIVPPTYILEEGTTAEIIKSSKVLDVNPEYEELCKTPAARKGISRLLQKRRREYAEKIGREIMEQELKRCNLPIEILYDPSNETIRYILEFLNLKNLAELFIRIGQDLLSPRVISDYLQHTPKNTLQEITYTISIGQIDKGVHKFAHCCNPYPGEEDALVVLSERGVTIHKNLCKDLIQRHKIPKDRLLKVRWAMGEEWDCPLMFVVVIPSASLNDLFANWSPLRSSGIQIKKLEEELIKPGLPLSRIVVVFDKLKDAKEFMEPLYKKYPQASIESYSRYRPS